MIKKAYQVTGMHCASCAYNIQKKLKTLEGVASCDVNYATEKANVQFSNEVSIEKINEVLLPLGYKFSDKKTSVAADEKTSIWPFYLALCVFVAMAVQMIFNIQATFVTNAIFAILATLTLFIPGKIFLKGIFNFAKYLLPQ